MMVVFGKDDKGSKKTDTVSDTVDVIILESRVHELEVRIVELEEALSKVGKLEGVLKKAGWLSS